jgi:mono/diheme cytochrome c family protein
MQAPKNGFFYVLDAKSGELISAEKLGPVTWASHVDLKTGRPVENPEARYEVTGKQVLVAPSAGGFHNWHPMAYSPDTGLVYIPVAYNSQYFAPVAKFEVSSTGFNTGVDNSGPGRAQVPETFLLAWDPINAKPVWSVKNETAGQSGILATAGDLVFSGNHNGEMVAYDAATGKRLWAGPTQARIVAAPAAYAVDGQQFIAVLAAAPGLPPNQIRTNPRSANNSRLLVYRLGGTATLPDKLLLRSGEAIKIDPPLLTASAEAVATGDTLYAQHCAECHGGTAVPGPGSTAPDLRYSSIISVGRAAWDSIVLRGERVSHGMPSFGGKLSQPQGRAILAYVVKRANDEKASQEAGDARAN